MKHFDSADIMHDAVTITQANGTFAQHTNGIDGILRDYNDDPIRLDPSEFRHQAYHGRGYEPYRPPAQASRFVFRGGKLLEVDGGACI